MGSTDSSRNLDKSGNVMGIGKQVTVVYCLELIFISQLLLHSADV